MHHGSGKVAGKVLIVDPSHGYAKLLILLNSVSYWFLDRASNLSPGAPYLRSKVLEP